MDRALLLLGFCVGLLMYSCSLNSADISNEATQFTKDTVIIASYLTQNNIHATKLPLGIWFLTDSVGVGIRPVFDDTLKLSYTLKLLPSNTIVGQSNAPTFITFYNLLTGVQGAISQFQKGSKGRIFIPSFDGFGVAGTATIPSNSNLIYEFKIDDVYDHQLKIDTTAIDAYLKTNSISALKDVSGLRYTIDSLGTGLFPSLQGFVTVKYTAKILESGLQIDQSTIPIQIQMLNSILGWQIGLRHVPEGSKVTLYVPSRLAYGSSVYNSIPANSNLVFKIQLSKVN